MSRIRRGTVAVTTGLALALSACTGGGDETSNAAKPSTGEGVELVATDCPVDVRTSVVDGVECSYLTVPEDREHPGRLVKVFVAVVQAPVGSPEREPMLVTSLANTPNYGGIAPLAQRVGRDVVIVDTRGSGHSTPSLACPEIQEARDLWSLATGSAERLAVLEAAVSDCYARLTDEGVDLASYDVVEAARDLADLRVALDVPEWNVISYGPGSRIASELLRHSPESIRTVVLDSPDLPGTDARAVAGPATRQAVEAVLASCAADRTCHAAHPDSQKLLPRAMQSLDRKPMELVVTIDSQPQQVAFDAGFLARALRQILSDTGSSGPLFLPESVPDFLESVVSRDTDVMTQATDRLVKYEGPQCLGYHTPCLPAHRLAHGVELTVLCRDVAPFSDARPAPIDLGFDAAFMASPYWDLCRSWPVEPAPAEVAAPLTSDVPALIAVGGLAPYSPESVVRGAASGLSAASYVVDPGGTHNVVPRPCVAEVRNAWVDEPALLDTNPCADEEAIPWQD